MRQGIVRLARRQAEPDREPLGIDDRVELGRETAPRATETMISTPLFRVASISRSHTPARRHRTKRL